MSKKSCAECRCHRGFFSFWGNIINRFLEDFLFTPRKLRTITKFKLNPNYVVGLLQDPDSLKIIAELEAKQRKLDNDFFKSIFSNEKDEETEERKLGKDFAKNMFKEKNDDDENFEQIN